jgi:hypothetical protein
MLVYFLPKIYNPLPFFRENIYCIIAQIEFKFYEFYLWEQFQKGKYLKGEKTEEDHIMLWKYPILFLAQAAKRSKSRTQLVQTVENTKIGKLSKQININSIYFIEQILHERKSRSASYL